MHCQASCDNRQACSCSAAAEDDGICLKSGLRPSRSMSVLRGVRYLPTVKTSPDESFNSYTLCIKPLPYVLHGKAMKVNFKAHRRQSHSRLWLQSRTVKLDARGVAATPPGRQRQRGHSGSLQGRKQGRQQGRALGADQERSAVVPQRARKDLARAGGVLVDQNGQRPGRQRLPHRSHSPLLSQRSALCDHYGCLVCAEGRRPGGAGC